MPSLAINLEEGFANDTVVVRVDSREVFHREGITTDLSAGLAGSVRVEVPQGTAHLAVDVPSKGLSKTEDLQVSADVYVRVLIHNGNIDVRTSSEPTYYL